jgi:hypothetical protein
MITFNRVIVPVTYPQIISLYPQVIHRIMIKIFSQLGKIERERGGK